MAWRGILEEYKSFLPVGKNTPVVSLLEGNTPLVHAANLQKTLFGDAIELYLKCEGMNPTGSFKDRGMAMAISKAKEEGAKAVACASTGNTSSSAAAYAARAGMECVVLVPAGSIALGKLAQSLVHGAKVLAVEGLFDDAFKMVKKLTEACALTLVNSVNPYRLEGQKTGAFEVCDQSGGKAPDFHAIPVGNAGNIAAYWQGYNEYKEAGKGKGLPRMLGFQAAGAAPIVEGKPVAKPRTIATAIRIGNPANWKKAEAAASESGGSIGAVPDEEILEAYKMLADTEGVFVEPASATALAGVMRLHKDGYFKNSAKKRPRVVCTLTGHGLKDPDRAIKVVGQPKAVKANIDAVCDALGYAKARP